MLGLTPCTGVMGRVPAQLNSCWGWRVSLGNPCVPEEGWLSWKREEGWWVPPERGRAWVQHPGAQTSLPCAFLNLASPLGQEFVLGKHCSRCTTNTSAASRRGRRGRSLKSEPKERATSAFLAGLGPVVVL